MAAENFAVSRMPPPRRLHTARARQGRPDTSHAVCLPAYICGFGCGPVRLRTRDEEYPARPAQTVRRPDGPARQRTAQHTGRQRRGSLPHSGAYSHPAAARQRAMRKARHARRRLAALLMLAGLFAGWLALHGLAPGLAETGANPPRAFGSAPPQPAGPAADAVQSPLTLMLQQPALPNGCETVSLAMLLDQAGCPVDPVELFGGYIPHEPFQYAGNERYGPDPETAYAGDAASARNGWYCFEGPVVEGANACLSAYGSGRRARAVTGLDEEGLAGYLDAGIPLAVWVTRGYEPPRTGSFSWILPDGSRYTPYANLHCVVLAGRQEGGQYRIADPLDGWQTVEPSVFWQSFDAMGRRAVVVE